MYYVFSFNKAFVPMALELGGRLKECVVILGKVWAYAAELSLREKRTSLFFHCQDGHKCQSYPWATSAEKTDPTLSLDMTGSCSPWGIGSLL